MYKGYKSERAFYNAKIHALACTINAETADIILKDNITKIIGSRPQAGLFTDFRAPETDRSNSGSWRVTNLTDGEARGLYYQLLKDCKNVKANLKASNMILGIQGIEMSDSQRKRIIKLAKYNFGWTVEVTFSKILEFCPELAKRLTPWQIQNTKIQPLYSLMSKVQANRVIKRLEKIERRNKENEMS